MSTPSGPGDMLSGDGRTPISPEGSGDFASGNYDAALCEDREVEPGAMPGLVRLTHRQYDYAVRDLLGLDARASTDFLKDQQFFGFDNNAQKLSVPENQVLRYQTTAERLAGEAAADLSKIARVVSCAAPAADNACRDQFLSKFLKRMFRRPLSDAERTRYEDLFEAGADLYEEGTKFQRGVRLVLEAALQAPSFVYRAELRDSALDGEVVALNDHEIAARLALTLWSSLPDAKLMAKADAGKLHEASDIEAEARRMLEDPKASRVLDDFHSQWLEFERLRFDKDGATFPDYRRDAFQNSAQRELLAFAKHVALEGEGSIADLFTSPVGFVDATLASVYGLEGDFGSELTRVELDPKERSGLLTSAGFLAGHADALDPSPIHRGAYIQKRVMCTTFGPLPGNVGNLPERTAEIVTTRDQVEVKTEPAPCQGCHALINPAGFAFEHFDTLGRARAQDHGAPIDATGSLALDGKNVKFDGAIEFTKLLGSSGTVSRCYETQWFRFAMGRGEANDDICLLHEIDTQAKAKGYSVKEMLVALTLSRGFRYRAQEDL